MPILKACVRARQESRQQANESCQLGITKREAPAIVAASRAVNRFT